MKRRWFQIHLNTAIVMMFVAGYGMLLWHFRSPWRETGEIIYKNTLGVPWSPDGTRWVRHYTSKRIEILASGSTTEILCIVDLPFKVDSEPGFIDNDTIHDAIDGKSNNSGQIPFCVLKRRFPEWWWGHFYRPEVWVGVVIAMVWIAITFVRRREARKP
jgi:hypothetical protein